MRRHAAMRCRLTAMILLAVAGVPDAIGESRVTAVAPGSRGATVSARLNIRVRVLPRIELSGRSFRSNAGNVQFGRFLASDAPGPAPDCAKATGGLPAFGRERVDRASGPGLATVIAQP
ncbi:MAG: hypothetical protein R3E48_21430 [Burkholderiaceae bacterium]